MAGTIRGVAVLCALALLAGGCGSGGGSSTSTSTSTPTTTTASSTSTTTTSASTTPSTSGLGFLTSSNCAQLVNLSQSFAQAMSGDTKNLVKSAQLVKEFADKTPASIRPDFEILAAAYTKVAAALKGVDLTSGGVPSASVIAKLTTLSSQLNSQQLTQASQHITAWAQKNCGVTGG